MSANVVEIKTFLLESSTAEVQERIKQCVVSARSERELSTSIKTELDRAEKGEWNVVLGRDFGASVFHKSKSFAHFRVGELEILVWKS